MSAICGIFGASASRPDASRVLDDMLATLESRGPDALSRHVSAPEQLCLGFRFLRTETGEANPGIFTNEDGSMVMACDGHVFNQADIRGSLEGRGHRLKTAHSAELLLHLYEDDGPTAWRRVDGQFALALWDARNRRLVLGRDFLGVRALYYWQGPEGIVFASEIKALLEHPNVPRSVDETAVSDFLTFTSVPGPRTLFRDINKLPAGTVAIFAGSGRAETTRYWDLLADPIDETDDERFYVDKVRALHLQAVAGRDVKGPIASLLSGGNDSSANASLLARRRSDPLHTFTVGLASLEGNEKYNDLEYARRVARFIHSTHHEYLLSTDEFLATIPVTIEAMDDLVSEPSSVFLYHALRLAKEQGLRVVVTGEANDELCCGHGGMIHIRNGYYRRWLPFMRKPRWLRKALAATVPMAAPKYRDILTRAARDEEYFWSYETAWMDSEKADVLSPDLSRSAEKAARVVAQCRRRYDESAHGRRDYLYYVIYSMMQDFYFSNLMLGKLDLLAAAVGVEPRCPYTSPEYAHFVYNIPTPFKMKDGLVKYFFKKAIEGVLPDEIIYRPKQGFRTPVIELFQGALGDWAEPILLETGLTRAGLIRRQHLEDLLRRHRRGESDQANRLWTVMTLNLWHERWIANRSVADRSPALSAS